MRVVVVGAGPVGTVTAIGLRRQGHEVCVIERDGGPAADGSWQRKGLMQFRLPHGFRPIVHEVLRTLMPDVWDRLLAAGCEPSLPPDADPAVVPAGLSARRSTFDRGMRAALGAEPGLQLRVGRASEIVRDGARLVGVRVDGRVVAADCVVVATGRSDRLGQDLRAAPLGGPSGMAYTARLYRAMPSADVSGRPLFPRGAEARGFVSILFPHDAGTLTALIERPSEDRRLAEVGGSEAFDAVLPHIPNLAPWTEPGRFEPISEVMNGTGLHNRYQSTLDAEGRLPVPGVLFAGDSVLCTNPAGGRGVSTGLQQAAELLRLLGEHAAPGRPADFRALSQAFDAWCQAWMRPWFEDHVLWDRTLLRRWSALGLDLDDEIPSDLVAAAAEVDERIAAPAAAFTRMTALPTVLDPYREDVRALLRTGWRPVLPPGPSRDDLVEIIAATPGRRSA